MTEGGTAAQRALGEARTFNTAMNDQFDKGMDYRQSALTGIGSGQQNLTRDVASLAGFRDAYDKDAAGKMAFATTMTKGMMGAKGDKDGKGGIDGGFDTLMSALKSGGQ